jgi:hypothetical protein
MQFEGEPIYNATLDMADDKIRIYSGRVSEELFDALRKLGFQRAYQQECFFAVWSPGREDCAIGLCGGLDDEQTTPEERAEAKAERLAGYSANAGKRAEQADAAARQIFDMIPFGQPILVGHHSEGRARRDQERIENRTRKAVENWRKEEYWRDRAQGVLAHAEHRERPDVILRRIKKLEAERRKREKEKMFAFSDLEWAKVHFIEKAFGYSMFDEYTLTPEQEAEVAADLERSKAANTERCDRWIAHLDLRLAYERELYDNADGPKPDVLVDRLKPGCMIKARSWGWVGPVKRVNRGRDGQVSSVSIPSWTGGTWNDTIPVDKILEVQDGDYETA